MKIKVTSAVILLVFLLPFSLQGQNSFQAKMTDRRLGYKKILMVRANGEKYRYDFFDSGKEVIVIVNPAKEKTAILMPQKKQVHITETSSRISRLNDPVQAVMSVKDQYTEKKVGTEVMAGFNCTKSELYDADKKIFTIWFSNKLNFPLRIENNLSPHEYIELYAIVMQKIAPSVFVIPEGYTEVDDRMRPIIPEPPPP